MPESDPREAPGEPGTEGLYPIRTVASLTGVNPVTLRAWERRYGLIRPKRTPKGHRLYAEADIERIRQVLSLLDQGIPIGQTRRLLDDELATTAATPEGRSASEPWQGFRERMLQAVARFDTAALETAYSEALSLYPVHLVTRELVGPLAEDFRTRADSPEGEAAAEAHFFHAFMRNKLGARLHHQGARARGPRLVAAGLPGECTETALLLFCLEATAYDYRIVLLGGDMPLRPIPHVARRADARGIFLFGEGGHAADIEESLQALVAAAPCPVAVAGAVAAQRRPAVERAGAHALPEAESAGIGAIRTLLRSGC